MSEFKATRKGIGPISDEQIKVWSSDIAEAEKRKTTKPHGKKCVCHKCKPKNGTFNAKAIDIFDQIVTAKPGNHSILRKKEAVEIIATGLASSYEDGQKDFTEWQNAGMTDGQ